MNYLPLQLIVSLFVLLMVIRLVKKYRDQVLTTWEFMGWLVIWLLGAMVFWLPQASSKAAKILGIGRGADLAVYLSVLLIFYLIFKLNLKIDKQQAEITKIARHLALNETPAENNPVKTDFND